MAEKKPKQTNFQSLFVGDADRIRKAIADGGSDPDCIADAIGELIDLMRRMDAFAVSQDASGGSGHGAYRPELEKEEAAALRRTIRAAVAASPEGIAASELGEILRSFSTGTVAKLALWAKTHSERMARAADLEKKYALPPRGDGLVEIDDAAIVVSLMQDIAIKETNFILPFARKWGEISPTQQPMSALMVYSESQNIGEFTMAWEAAMGKLKEEKNILYKDPNKFALMVRYLAMNGSGAELPVYGTAVNPYAVDVANSMKGIVNREYATTEKLGTERSFQEDYGKRAPSRDKMRESINDSIEASRGFAQKNGFEWSKEPEDHAIVNSLIGRALLNTFDLGSYTNKDGTLNVAAYAEFVKFYGTEPRHDNGPHRSVVQSSYRTEIKERKLIAKSPDAEFSFFELWGDDDVSAYDLLVREIRDVTKYRVSHQLFGTGGVDNAIWLFKRFVDRAEKKGNRPGGLKEKDAAALRKDFYNRIDAVMQNWKGNPVDSPGSIALFESLTNMSRYYVTGSLKFFPADMSRVAEFARRASGNSAIINGIMRSETGTAMKKFSEMGKLLAKTEDGRSALTQLAEDFHMQVLHAKHGALERHALVGNPMLDRLEIRKGLSGVGDRALQSFYDHSVWTANVIDKYSLLGFEHNFKHRLAIGLTWLDMSRALENTTFEGLAGEKGYQPVMHDRLVRLGIDAEDWAYLQDFAKKFGTKNGMIDVSALRYENIDLFHRLGAYLNQSANTALAVPNALMKQMFTFGFDPQSGYGMFGRMVTGLKGMMFGALTSASQTMREWRLLGRGRRGHAMNHAAQGSVLLIVSGTISAMIGEIVAGREPDFDDIFFWLVKGASYTGPQWLYLDPAIQAFTRKGELSEDVIIDASDYIMRPGPQIGVGKDLLTVTAKSVDIVLDKFGFFDDETWREYEAGKRKAMISAARQSPASVNIFTRAAWYNLIDLYFASEDPAYVPKSILRRTQ